jgi:hypothetical protein
MSEAKLQAARELINEKRYAAARALLLTIAHTDARAMLAELDAASGFHDVQLDHAKENFTEIDDLRFTALESDDIGAAYGDESEDE